MITAPTQHPSKDGVRRCKFTTEEDTQLTEFVKTYGNNDWFTIACLLPGRTARQCRERWNHYLSPTVSCTPFTPWEDALLAQKYAEFGPKWKAIAASFEGRTDIHVKNRWLFLARRHHRATAAVQDISPHQPSRATPALPIMPQPERPAPPPPDDIPWSSDQEEDGSSTLQESTGELRCEK
jgi:hypothetical protein